MPTPVVHADPITLELVREGLVAVAREMRANMMRTAYSSIIYEGQDFSCAIVDNLGQLAAKSPVDNPLHIFPLTWSVRMVLEHVGGDIHPGDVFLHNDPYTGGTHLNDAATIYPVFLDEGLFAFTVVRVHWGDIGGMTPGSISGQATEIYQEGVRIPAIRIYERGKPNAAALDLIFANVRGERERRGDFTASLVSCQQAAKKLEAMAAKYGTETLRTCMARFIQRAEERMRQQIAGLPDGTYAYEAYTESTGRALEPLAARLALTVRGDELVADFSGSSPESEGPTNCGPALAPTAVLIIAKSYLDPSETVNHGAWLPLRTILPERSFLNARLPAACGGMNEARYAADTAMMGALAAVVPEAATGDNKGCGSHVYIGGHDDNGRSFLFYEYPAGGTGAWGGGDGNNTVRNFQEGDFASIQPVEAIENESPLLVERCEIRRDSAGAGRWRGGFGLRREVRLLAARGTLSILTDRNILRPHGVFGAEAGAGHRYTVRRDDQEIEPSPIPGKVTGFSLRRGDVVVMRTSGGGGYGDPLERDPALVWHDIVEGYVSREAAARGSYGVVVTATGVDAAAATALREELRAARCFATIAATDEPELVGSRRILPLARGIAARAGVGEGDVVELLHPRRAPLRAWARLVDEEGDRAYLGPRGLAILGLEPGERIRLRRLSAWGMPPIEP